MASSHNSSEYVENLSDYYGNSVIASEKSRSDILAYNVSEDLEFEVDLLISGGEGSSDLQAYEVKETGSLRQYIIVKQAMTAKKQCDKLEEAFSCEGFNVDAGYVIKPVRNLETAYSVYDFFGSEPFNLEDAEDLIGEEVSGLEDRAFEQREDGLYEIKEELEPVFESGIVQP